MANSTATIEVEILLKDLDDGDDMRTTIFEQIEQWMDENLEGEEGVHYWNDCIYNANYQSLKLKEEYSGCVYFDVTFPYEYDLTITNPSQIKENEVE
jgi:hypothetical protein